MSIPVLTRPSWRPRRRHLIVVLAGVTGALTFAAGLVVGSAIPDPDFLPPDFAPAVATPQVASVITPLVVAVTAPTAAAEPAPEAAAAPVQLRALTPHVRAECLVPLAPGNPAPVSCSWQDGFPALSADGRTIATRVTAEDPSGLPGDWVNFYNMTTSELTSVEVLRAGELADTRPADLEALRARVVQRGATAQRRLDAGAFHSLIFLGSRHDSPERHEEQIYAEIHDSLVRVVDPVTATVIGEHAFGVERPQPRNPDPDADCQGWNFHNLSVWWEPTTRILVGESMYHTGGCMCPSSTFYQAFRLH